MSLSIPSGTKGGTNWLIRTKEYNFKQHGEEYSLYKTWEFLVFTIIILHCVQFLLSPCFSLAYYCHCHSQLVSSNRHCDSSTIHHNCNVDESRIHHREHPHSQPANTCHTPSCIVGLHRWYTGSASQLQYRTDRMASAQLPLGRSPFVSYAVPVFLPWRPLCAVFAMPSCHILLVLVMAKWWQRRGVFRITVISTAIFLMLLGRRFSFGIATFATYCHFVPIAFPLFPPDEGSVAYQTDLGG